MSDSTTTADDHSQYTPEIKEEASENMISNLESTKEWDARMELALFNAISRCKPVGIHKHFRIISIQKQFNQNSPVHCDINEIWAKLNEFYGMEALDELAEEDDEHDGENEEAKGGQAHEFNLPLEDYEQLISEHRQDNHSEEEETPTSPTLPPAKRTRTSKREVSPTSTGDSVTSTPEPEEGKSSRRRGNKKSEATPEPPSGRNHSSANNSRRTGRSSGTTRGSGAKRQTSKRK
ncbi:chromatin modification-related protein EAF7-domain-containing protein [Sporodiniella umbellata]|nr:chromatin modification-related protein EAF7-domain-containing protein [Sporodiniella umbellata]